MIYAIRAVGTQFIKFGRASSVGRRMRELETGCPHELSIEAVADWPDGKETAIHQYLSLDCEKYEWFRESDRTAKVIGWLQEGPGGLLSFNTEYQQTVRIFAEKVA